MKRFKIVILLAVMALALAACSNNQATYNENSAPKAMDNFNEAGIISRMLDLKNGLKPNVKPSGVADTAKAADANAVNNQTAAAANERQLENLAAQFSGAIIRTNLGDITVKFYAQDAPVTVNNFMTLAKAGFYNGTKFHRVIKDFMIQAGDPFSKDDANMEKWGTGGPGYQFQDEINQHKLVKGSLAMANSGANTNGSQFFIVTAEATSWLDGKHTNFGYVAAGIEIVEQIGNVQTGENDRPVDPVVIKGVELVK
ncbi:MAG: peptidylprolyl isomerase [Patescibacteria group bacterium]|nr:peptidylprolyl isomerase [Patescibacteria group bacterium]